MTSRLFQHFRQNEKPNDMVNAAPIESTGISQSEKHNPHIKGNPETTHMTISESLFDGPTPTDGGHSQHLTEESETETETGKEVCSSSRFGVLVNFLLIHLPSIGVSMILFAFHIAGLCWDTEPTADQLSALQFPAKAHELLIMMSLTDILLHRIMYGLLGKEGLALGFITAPFHVADPLYLASPDFWRTARRPQRNRNFHRNTIGLLVVLVVLGVTVGPFSATTMTPRQDYVKTRDGDSWYQDHVVPNENLLYISRDPYPTELTVDFTQQAFGICIEFVSEDWDTAAEDCSAYDFKPFIEAVAGLKEVSWGGAHVQYNITVTRDGSITPYRPLSTNMAARAGIASGPMDFVAYDLSRYSVASTGKRDVVFQSRPELPEGTSSTLSKWKLPLVAATCAQGIYNGASGENLSFAWRDELLTHNLTMPIPELDGLLTSIDHSNTSSARAFSLDIRDQIPLPGISTSLVIANTTTAEREKQGMDAVELYMCHIIARWHEADTWSDTRLPTGAQSELRIAPNKTFEYVRAPKHKESQANITINHEFLQYMGPLETSDNTTTDTIFNTDFADMLEASIRQSGGTWWALSKLLAMYFADSMSMSTQSTAVARTELDTLVNGPNDVAIGVDAIAYSHLYTYNLSNTRSRPVAFALLFFHAALAIVHHLIIGLSRKPWHSTGWGSAEELISLALRSRSPEDVSMDDIVTSSAPRRMPIVIRERSDDKRLEMVIATANPHPSDAEASGSDVAAVRGQVKRVQSGIKYN